MSFQRVFLSIVGFLVLFQASEYKKKTHIKCITAADIANCPKKC